jgi:DNA-directed RNA polymerase specialized sigma24 family protein
VTGGDRISSVTRESNSMPNRSRPALDHLLRRVADRRDPEALSDIYGATKTRLFATALLIVRRRDLAEDVLQKAYAQIWSRAGADAPSSGLALAWMIGVTRSLALEAIRSDDGDQHPEGLVAMDLPALPAVPAEAEGPEGPPAGTTEQERALSAFTALSAPRRDLIVAAYLLGESKQCLARRTGVASETVGCWLRGALLEIDLACRDIPAGTRQ